MTKVLDVSWGRPEYSGRRDLGSIEAGGPWGQLRKAFCAWRMWDRPAREGVGERQAAVLSAEARAEAGCAPGRNGRPAVRPLVNRVQQL